MLALVLDVIAESDFKVLFFTQELMFHTSRALALSRKNSKASGTFLSRDA